MDDEAGELVKPRNARRDQDFRFELQCEDGAAVLQHISLGERPAESSLVGYKLHFA